MAEIKPTFRPHINLPKLQIPPYDGNPLELWDSFNNAVHHNPDLHSIDKMNYLKCMITGDAARAISELPITSQNFDTAIGMLQGRFGRKQVLINAHIESLSKLTTPSMEVQQLRKFYDNCESNISTLKTLALQRDCYGSLLIPILLKNRAKQRKMILNQKKRCFNCLRSGYTKYQRRSGGRCLNSGLKPYFNFTTRTKSRSKKKKNRPKNKKTQNKTAKAFGPHTATPRTNALLQTAIVTASGPTTRHQARILVDTGSHKTFITQLEK